jgi:two-component system chemotaxis sensor kinase CheA
MTARYEQGRIVLTVQDDGRGIDHNKIRRVAVTKGLISEDEAAALSEEQAVDLIFLPGLSTASKVSDISGRGVGMDIVHTNIQKVNGTISVETHLGHGTVFTIHLPLTLAIVPTLLVKVAKSVFAIPLVMVTETRRLTKNDIKTIGGKPVTLLRGHVLPLLHLSSLFDLGETTSHKGFVFAVVVHSGKQKVGLVVDSLTGQEEVVVKSLSSLIGDLPGISSAAILGDGKVALILDVPGLFKYAGVH